MDLDALFKIPTAPASGLKRKLVSSAPTAEELERFNASRRPNGTTTTNGSTTASTVAVGKSGDIKGKMRAATVQDGSDDEAERDDFAPGNDADYFTEEDSDGRFFGGGLTSEQKQILEIMDDDRDPSEAAMTLQGLRKMVSVLEKAVAKNVEMRAKFAGNPHKFVESEIALDTALHALLLLTQSPGSFYPELIKLGIISTLVDLLSHENVDISIAVITILEELTDEDVGEGEDGEESTVGLQAELAVKALADELVKCSILELLTQNVRRLDLGDETERNGVYHALSLFENLLSATEGLALRLTKTTDLLAWLLQQVQQKATKDLEQIRFYAAEILSMLLSTGDDTIRQRFGALDGVDVCLTTLSAYRKRDPKGAEELEFMENVFDILCSALATTTIKQRFLEGEGVELMVLLMKQKMLARTRSIKVLDHALSGEAGISSCERFVEALGLRTLFSAFMGKSRTGKRKASESSGAEDDEHILGILNSLLSNLASESESRLRLLAKFVEDGYEKVDRLLELRETAQDRVKSREGELASERRTLQAEGLDYDEDDEYFRRLEAGLFTLQLVDYVIAWIVMEDDGIQEHVRLLLSRKDMAFADVVDVLKEYRDNIGSAEDVKPSNGFAAQPNEALEPVKQRDIIEALMDYLSGLS
ncbi:uncharacterized protein L969DRAFT_100397 [Mixia osmundae IAM 14324]|uniref:Beta-catenin-like protein 1 N-terminal domain-containing protein n=1 Tax=Mixia osmundae (strain CBS 9802 / IAM 14324 / JCM 22182 / KY 12970) TaxID=764103 RepID=G7E4M4_MIXOS|nr:uncharacterized protein L969DRAFT_100397 [Mixia osmundae IAM 14324]KEI41836.1 hypothetical protein L969DRAFT_100397 [Mixia osmundae IAM 14324]GAA97784.1 hypothetical protein E5Q_04463 [Mixia osmundae IAM 14324]